MKKRSHKLLGIYLADRYMPHVSELFRRAFIIGCIEPDYNYISYLKGWEKGNRAKGHNYQCACRYIHKIADRLSEKDSWNLRDFYRFGRMLHYLADAFTFPHNSHYTGTLADHVRYELEMQPIFMKKLQDFFEPEIRTAGARESAAEELSRIHADYCRQASNPERDCDMILQTLCFAAAVLIPAAECRRAQIQISL